MKTIEIIYEDEEILLVNKSEGLSVQGGNGVSHSLDEDLSIQLGYKVFLVHRLDKETSGILIVAKSSESASKWTNLISSSSVTKSYTAICLGKPYVNGKYQSSGTIKSVIEAHGRKQEAFTNFEVAKTVTVKNDLGEDITLSLLSLTLGTGRMHQIRIQMAGVNCPVAADDKHGNFKLNKQIRKLGIKKLQLASTKLTLPIKNKLRTFEIPLPKHMQDCVETYF